MSWLKRLLSNTLITTSLSLVVLAVIVRIQGFDLFFSRGVLVAFGANVAIHLGLQLTQKFKSKYLALEVFVDVAYTTAVLIVFGYVFDLFGATPIPALVLIAASAHIAALFLNLTRTRKDAGTGSQGAKKRNMKPK